MPGSRETAAGKGNGIGPGLGPSIAQERKNLTRTYAVSSSCIAVECQIGGKFRYKFVTFKNEDLKNYKIFIEILDSFMDYHGLKGFSRKEIDRYLWLLGKENFPKTNQRK